MDLQQQDPIDQNQISSSELFEILWGGKGRILGVTVLLTAAAALGAWFYPKSYKATVLLATATSSGGGQQGALGSLASQFGGLAALTGIPVSGDSKRFESVAVLQSESLTEKYIRDNDLLPILFKRRWDSEKKRWKTSDPERIPTLWKGNEFFKKEVRLVTNDTKTGLTSLTITWDNPHMAAKWANDLVDLTNDYLRAKAIDESERNIAFLTEQAQKTNVVEAKQAIYKILENEISKSMLARGSKEFAFKILDPAVAPEKPTSPQMLVWISAGAIGGLFLGAALVFGRSARTTVSRRAALDPEAS